MDRTGSAHQRFLIPAAVVFAVLGVLLLTAAWLQPRLDVAGVSDGGAVRPAAMGEVEITTSGDPGRVEVLLDGVPAPLERDGERLRLAGDPELAEGEHTLSISAPGSIPMLRNEKNLEFAVDATPPVLAVQPVPPTELDAAAEISGTVTGSESVIAQGQPVELDGDGAFTVPVAPGTATVHLEAVDEAGNTAVEQVTIPVQHPGMRAVHMTALAWSAASLREPVMQMAREGRIDTVQLDIKDESGEIGYASQVPLAQEIGASLGYYDARAALDEMHAAGLRVVGRLVAFRDPVLAEASWNSGDHDRVLQDASGMPYSGGYGQYSFTNFANPEVRAYNVALAAEAAELGFDDILYDYVRRPDGDLSKMHIPGLTTTPEQSIADFLAETRPAVREHGALLGASVFGIAATRPTEIAQDIPAIAANSDYVAPMVYPSHWGPGEYNVAYPEGQPFDITARSLADFVNLTKDSATAVVPWLQAFSLRETYGPAEVRAQIEAAESVGITSFLLWNASCRYDPAALDPVAPQ